MGLFDPTLTPFTFHTYNGVVPPFVGVAVNVTGVPAQTLFDVVVMIILTAGLGVTVTT